MRASSPSRCTSGEGAKGLVELRSNPARHIEMHAHPNDPRQFLGGFGALLDSVQPVQNLRHRR